MPEPTRAPTMAPTAPPAPAPVRAAASGPMARMGRPGIAKPAAASPRSRAPSPPPATTPTPAPSAALLPSSVVVAVLGKWRFRASSDIRRLTSSFPYPRLVRQPYPRSAPSRSRNMQVIICRDLSSAIARLLQALVLCQNLGRMSDVIGYFADEIFFMPSPTVMLSPTFTLSSAGGGKCSFIRPSAVFTSTQPFFASTLVTSPSMVCTPSVDAVCAEAVATRGAKAKSVARARVFMVCPLGGADRSASLPPLLLVAPVVAVIRLAVTAALLAGALPALTRLVTRLPRLLASLLTRTLTALLLPTLVLMTLLLAIL